MNFRLGIVMARSPQHLGHRRKSCTIGLITIFLLCKIQIVFAADGAGTTKVDSRPYNVQIMVAFDAPLISETMQRDLCRRIEVTADRLIGPCWQLKTEIAQWINPKNSSGLARIRPESLLKHITNLPRKEGETNSNSIEQLLESDVVVFAATIADAHPGYQLAVRSWVPSLDVATESVVIHQLDSRELPESLLRLCWRSFRPFGLVEGVEGNTAHVRLRAGSLVPAETSMALITEDEVFAPIVVSRSKDRNNNASRLRPVPWTLLCTTNVDGQKAVCEIGSGLRSPLSAKQRGRIETVAVAVRQQFPATRLDLATQSKPSLSLMAHRLELRSSPQLYSSNDEAVRNEHLIRELISDRRGQVIIPADGDRKFLWLFAFSGNQLLARVPFVPGCVGYTRLEVPDDSSRLTTEAEIQILQGTLIEAVAKRNTAFAEIRTAAKKEQWNEVTSKVKDLGKLQSINDFRNRLSAIRVTGTQLARSRKDRTGEIRVNRLCDEADELVRLYLSEDKLKTFIEEIAGLEKASKEHANNLPDNSEQAVASPQNTTEAKDALNEVQPYGTKEK